MGNVTRTDWRRLLIGQRVKECRKLMGITQDQLVDRITALPDNNGKVRSQKHLSYIENGKRDLSNDYALLLSQALNVRIDYLLLKDDYMTEDDRISAISESRATAEFLIIQIMQLHNFSLRDITKTEAVLIEEELEGVEQSLEYKQPTFELTSPRGSTINLSQQELTDLISSIDTFIDCQCAVKFKKPIDPIKNIYEWRV